MRRRDARSMRASDDSRNSAPTPIARPGPREDADTLLQELVAYLRENRTELREEWARRISEAELLGVMSDEEIFSEATEVYDNYVDALETGSIENLQTYARELSERIIPRGVETRRGARASCSSCATCWRGRCSRKYQEDLELLNRILDAYEPAANRIAVTVGVSFVEERERVIHEQQEAIRELSTPVLQVRDRLLILPIIGVLDSARARQLTEQLLGAIRDNRATVVVIDITGVATIDRTVANHLVQTVEASRLMGAQHDPHRPLVGDRPDARRSRRRPRHDEDGGRPAGRARGGRAAGRLSRSPTRATRPATLETLGRRRCRSRSSDRATYLIASIQSDLSDTEVIELRHELAELVGRHRAARDRDRRRARST